MRLIHEVVRTRVSVVREVWVVWTVWHSSLERTSRWITCYRLLLQLNKGGRPVSRWFEDDDDDEDDEDEEAS